VASIDRTAYPRFKRSISVRELREAYSPSLDELEWARRVTDSDEALLSLMLCLKCCQRLGYFARFDEIPAPVIEHVRQELGLHESVDPAAVPGKTVRNHRGLVRHRLGLVPDQATARKIAAEAIRAAARTKDNPADLINIALEELARSSCELPGYTTLDRMAGQIRAEVNTRLHELVHARMTGDEHRRILALLVVDPLSRRSGHDQLKDVAPKATVSRLRRHLDHLAWLDGIGSATAAWLKDIPAAKIGHFAAEASALDASEMGDFTVVKRIVLEVCLLHRARVQARDDLVTMLCKRMNTLHNKAAELLEEIRAEQRERNERMLAVFGEVLTAAQAIDADAQSATRPWPLARRRQETGKAVLEMIDAHGGLVGLLAEHEALAAYHGGSHLPLLERFYRSSRGLLLRLLNALEFEAASADHRLLHAIEWVRANQNRTSEYVTTEVHLTDPGTGITTRGRLDTTFAAEAWQQVIRDKRHPGKLAHRHFELCVLSCLADELVRGDVAVTGSDLYANWQHQLLSFADCQPYLAGYCEETGLPGTGAAFTAGLKAAMSDLAIQVDAGYPDNADLVIEEDGRPSLKARKGAERTASARALEAGVKERLPERSLLEALTRGTRWTRWHRHLGPLSGSDPKLANPLERYLLVALTYGCNLGPHQAARHLAGRVSAHELGATFGRHVTVAALDKAIADVVDAYLELDLAKAWGDASAVAVDGTKYEIYVDNLVAEFHIRYGGYGAIAYHYVADNYIALFSRFFPCGVWEAVYIIDGLLRQQSKADPAEIHADTQGQSFPVFGLAYLFGFDLLPRIRNFKDRTFYRPDPQVTYTHIDALFGDPVNWTLIESHWEDLMRVAISIRQGKLSSVALLRRLRHDSKRNKIYRAFRELGRVISTMVLLRYISDPAVRGHVSKATTMIESFNGFAKWLNFGNLTIGSNDPEDQEKYIKFNTLVADLVILSTAVDMSRVINELRAEGQQVRRADLRTIAPYQQENLRRFGDFAYDLTAPLETMEPHLDIDEDADASGTGDDGPSAPGAGAP
jgi:TnpA family transposase